MSRMFGCCRKCTENPHNTLLICFHIKIRPQNPNGLTGSQRVEFYANVVMVVTVLAYDQSIFTRTQMQDIFA